MFAGGPGKIRMNVEISNKTHGNTFLMGEWIEIRLPRFGVQRAACPGALRFVTLERIILPERKINHLSAACLCVLARRQVLAQAGHHLSQACPGAVWARVSIFEFPVSMLPHRNFYLVTSHKKTVMSG